MAGCSGVNPLGLLTGSSGPNVAANVQGGKTNNQTIGTSQSNAPSVSIRPNSRVETIDQSNDSNRVSADEVETVVVNEVPVWVILLLVLGWLFPSPGEIGRTIRSWFTKKDPT